MSLENNVNVKLYNLMFNVDSSRKEKHIILLVVRSELRLLVLKAHDRKKVNKR